MAFSGGSRLEGTFSAPYLYRDQLIYHLIHFFLNTVQGKITVTEAKRKKINLQKDVYEAFKIYSYTQFS